MQEGGDESVQVRYATTRSWYDSSLCPATQVAADEDKPSHLETSKHPDASAGKWKPYFAFQIVAPQTWPMAAIFHWIYSWHYRSQVWYHYQPSHLLL